MKPDGTGWHIFRHSPTRWWECWLFGFQVLRYPPRWSHVLHLGPVAVEYLHCARVSGNLTP